MFDYPIRLSTGEKIADAEALNRCLATNRARAKGNGYAAKAAQHILERIEQLTKKV